jgi:hypothetical protein
MPFLGASKKPPLNVEMGHSWEQVRAASECGNGSFFPFSDQTSFPNGFCFALFRM